MPIIAAIDPGIKNLGVCVADISGTEIHKILVWENHNLIAGESTQASTRCCLCGGPAKWSCSTATATTAAIVTKELLCQRCAKKGYRNRLLCPLTDFKVAALKKHLKEQGTDVKSNASKDSLMEQIALMYLLPFKPVKMKSPSTDDLYDATYAFFAKHKDSFTSCDRIVIENQKGIAHHMRSMQIMMYCIIRGLGAPAGKIVFVHAKKKTQETETETGQAGYQLRKAVAVRRIESELKKWVEKKPASAEPWINMWNSVKKQNDLADALSMVLDNTKLAVVSIDVVVSA